MLWDAGDQRVGNIRWTCLGVKRANFSEAMK